MGYTLKDEQKKALHAFVSGRDVFASLPTGYGKSLLGRREATFGNLLVIASSVSLSFSKGCAV